MGSVGFSTVLVLHNIAQAHECVDINTKSKPNEGDPDPTTPNPNPKAQKPKRPRRKQHGNLKLGTLRLYIAKAHRLGFRFTKLS